MTKGWTTKADLRYRIRCLEQDAVVLEKRNEQYQTHLERQYELGKEKATIQAHDAHRVEKI